LSDDNVIKFRKREKPQPPKQAKRPPAKGGPRVPPFVILILAALAVGAVTYALDQMKTPANSSREAAP
jgi:hypothetical protein